MKKFLVLVAFLASFGTQAGLISVETSDLNVAVGETVEVTVTGNDFTLVDTLSFNIAFDDSKFAYNSNSIGGDLFDASVAGFGFPLFLASYQTAPYSRVEIAFIDFFGEFIESNFTVATFTLTAIAEGQSSVAIADIVATEVIETAVAQVATQVSAPAISALLVLCGLFMMRKRTQR